MTAGAEIAEVEARARRVPRWLLPGAASLVLAAAAVVWSYLRHPPETEWAAVPLWAAGVLAMAIACREPGLLERWRRRVSWADLAALVASIAVSCAVILPWLSTYPLEVGGDALRDGGLLTRQIIDGEIKEVFSYAFFQGFTYLVPFLAVPFAHLFGATPLAFKVPAAIVGVLTAVLLFGLARRYLDALLSFVAVVVLLSIPI